MQAPRTRGHLIVIGASVRAATEAAARDGWEVSAVDQFGDADTRRAARAWYRLPSPGHLGQLIARLPSGGVMVTGGMEGWYETLDVIRRDREVWVPATEVLRTVREPRFLEAVARYCGFSFPEWREIREGAAPAGWLVKSRRLSGGRGVTVATPVPSGDGCYLQERAAGRPFGAAFLASGSDTQLIGLTRSMTRAIGCYPFLYAGSVGPVAIRAERHQNLVRLGETIRERAGLQGLFGVDLLLSPATERVTLLEINPRYTAGMELFEPCLGRSLVTCHVDVWRGQMPRLPVTPVGGRVKRVVWARHLLRWKSCWQDQIVKAVPTVTLHDLPQPGAAIDAGEPLVTVWAEGPQFGACLRQARNAEAELLRLAAAGSGL